jgi:C4-dicarboxylate-specific signal transduction histidine kinase
MTPEERFERMEHILAGWIEQSRRDYEENRRLWRETRDRIDAVSAQMAETDRRMKELSEETDRRFRDTDRRLKELGEATDRRISDLVSAIGKLIAAREQNGTSSKTGS